VAALVERCDGAGSYCAAGSRAAVATAGELQVQPVERGRIAPLAAAAVATAGELEGAAGGAGSYCAATQWRLR